MTSSTAAGRVDLLETVEILHEHLTEGLCQGVFDDVREGERRRLWTLERLAEFWVAVVLRAPKSLTHALAEASGGKGTFPTVEASDQAFFSRCQTLSWEFFARVFVLFNEAVAKAEPGQFCAHLGPLSRRFGGNIWALDGSSLDPVARRLKLLWGDRRVPLPGSVVAFYDVKRGTVARLRYETTPQGKEPIAAREELVHVPAGALVLADRLYGLPWFFEALTERGLFGITRRNQRANLVLGQQHSKTSRAAETVEDCDVEIGGERSTMQRVRCIRWRKGRKTLELLTNVLDRTKLSAQEALDLYKERWSIERLFYDLKEVLNLHRFYAANVNAVAMQVYAAAIVHVAMRAAQGRIAAKAKIAPEKLSTGKLFPKVAAASEALTNAELTFEAVRRANPKVKLRKPDWHTMAFAYTDLATVLVEKRGPGGRKKRIKAGRHSRRPLPLPPPQPPR